MTDCIGTIRQDFALSMGENSVHVSDAPETAATGVAQWIFRQRVKGAIGSETIPPHSRRRHDLLNSRKDARLAQPLGQPVDVRLVAKREPADVLGE